MSKKSGTIEGQSFPNQASQAERLAAAQAMFAAHSHNKKRNSEAIKHSKTLAKPAKKPKLNVVPKPATTLKKELLAQFQKVKQSNVSQSELIVPKTKVTLKDLATSSTKPQTLEKVVRKTDNQKSVKKVSAPSQSQIDECMRKIASGEISLDLIMGKDPETAHQKQSTTINDASNEDEVHQLLANQDSNVFDTQLLSPNHSLASSSAEDDLRMRDFGNLDGYDDEPGVEYEEDGDKKDEVDDEDDEDEEGEEDEEDEENEENEENKEEDGEEQYRKHSSLIDIEGSPIVQIDSGKDPVSQEKIFVLDHEATVNGVQVNLQEIAKLIHSQHCCVPCSEILTLLMQKINEALEEIKALKKELGQVLATLPAKVAVVPHKNKSRAELYPLVPSLPCKTKEELEHLSVLLKDRTGDVVPQFMAAINNIGGQNPADETRNIMKAVMTDNLAKVCSWVIDRPPPKTADPETVSKREPKLIVGEFDVFEVIASVVVSNWLNAKDKNGKDASTTIEATMSVIHEWIRRGKQRVQREILKAQKKAEKAAAKAAAKAARSRNSCANED